MKKYEELLENGFESLTWIERPVPLTDEEHLILEALINNFQTDSVANEGTLMYRLSVGDIFEVGEELFEYEELTVSDLAKALKSLEEKHFIELDFEEREIRLKIQFQTEW
jgi:DNA-binding MarR family transcriptional regulator